MSLPLEFFWFFWFTIPTPNHYYSSSPLHVYIHLLKWQQNMYLCEGNTLFTCWWQIILLLQLQWSQHLLQNCIWKWNSHAITVSCKYSHYFDTNASSAITKCPFNIINHPHQSQLPLPWLASKPLPQCSIVRHIIGITITSVHHRVSQYRSHHDHLTNIVPIRNVTSSTRASVKSHSENNDILPHYNHPQLYMVASSLTSPVHAHLHLHVCYYAPEKRTQQYPSQC